MESQENTPLELGRYWAVLKSRWLVVLGCTLLGGALAGAYAVTSPTTYTATAEVNLNVIADQPFSTQRSASGLIDPATETQLAKSSAVLTDAATDLGNGTTIADVRRAMTVTVLPEATVARITYDAGTLDDALAGADAVSKAFVDYRTVAAQDKVGRISNQLSKEQTQVSTELTVVNKAIATASSSNQRAAAVSRRTVLEAQLSSLLDQLSSIASIDTSGGYVITQAEDNAVAVQPHTRLLVQMGLAAGLVIGVIAAFVVNALDRRLATAADIGKAHGGPVLAQLSDRMAAVPAAPGDEDSYRSAAERLLAARGHEPGATTVVDLTTGEHPTVAVNLALGLAASVTGPVLVVLAEGEARLAAELVADHHGRAVPSPFPAIGPTAVRLGRGVPASQVDTTPPEYVVVALPPDASRSTVLAAARRTGGVVAVVECRRTRSGTLRSLEEDLSSVGAPVVGSVLAAHGSRRGRRLRRRRRGVTVENHVTLAADGV
ncbi:Wzz/FepE/Etk N-terminal domain-containing protein [Nocardioides mangrovi]|uniref:Polysaccharide chain length determinant N-terminal domain-containing protein n=1 Tax=Nocardioides mangrovi TaxID=2874580 RepID=A0ABS7UFG7_9ACTN|nr:Wzz/FepE/Etk N-terminal domain-containing protein [Nocardioides mangrovi]MBZ5739735.1 hypothetical protein [Nocardioides mangrovi]